ncbi:MAG: hypothetical protein RLZZ500_2000 [Bacteroidota bacterium]|jgi:hypothetical protein
MKKLIAVFALFLATSLSMSAQEKEMSVQELAKKDAVELAKLVGLPDTQTEDFFRLFEMKHEVMTNKNLSTERKTEMSNVIEAKIRGTLSPQQMAVLEANKPVFDRLIGKTKTTK